ncbi:hypothetical protein PPACK8108_LOCUS24479 [Phakopsora pachyrhizi]|uniref:Histone-lysine N-methyltransferase n=1 Tax=Phakopsora pachyrhizi TaxID=170000 RepID=A0AAV0BT49_PHAPC|nr:hypothetical protein PPACK8108_LOCUS24479 [Phakopsora pachyrhizi]
MWRPGKWVYAEDDDNQSNSETGSNNNNNNSSSRTDDIENHNSRRRSLPLEHPHSPPWKLGRVPKETAIFKDGRRMSKRFEKLLKDREVKLKPSTQQQSQPNATTPNQTHRRRERSKSIVSATATVSRSSTENIQHSGRRQRRGSVTGNTGSNSLINHHFTINQSRPHNLKSSSTQPEPESENEPLVSSNRFKPSKLSPTPQKRRNVNRSAPTFNDSSINSFIPSNTITTSIIPTTNYNNNQSIINNNNNNNNTLSPLSPKTQSDGPRPLATQINKATPPKLDPSQDDSNHNLVETFSKTESTLSDPHTPPAIGVHFESLVSTASSPHPPVAPLKRFRPWEALKGIQTDNAEVAGDLKLIHEAHLQRQNKSLSTTTATSTATSLWLSNSHQNHSKKRDSVNQPTEPNNSHEPSDSQQASLTPLNTFIFNSFSNPTDGGETSGTAHSPHSSSDLTDLSSSLSDLSDENTDQNLSSTSSSMIYSESDIEDDCLPESLVRKVRRPSTATTDKSAKIKWRRKRSAAIHRARRAMRSMAKKGLKSMMMADEDDESGGMSPPGYIKIKSNVYPNRKPEVSDLPPPLCGCTEGGCKENCLNRAMLYLCDPKRCQLGQSCTNIPFNQRKDIIDESTNKLGKGLKVFYTGPQRGWGLKTEIRLKEGMFLIDYRGEIISRENCYKRVLNEYREMKNFYFLDYDGSDVIDAGKKGNCSRFINHSCEPNLRVERFKLSGLEEYQFGLFCLRDIEVGEELLYNYGWQNFSDIAPTSNVRTSMRQSTSKDPITTDRSNSKITVDEEEDEDLNFSTLTTIKATAPTVQKCFCGSRICKGFLGIKRAAPNKNNAYSRNNTKSSTNHISNNKNMKRTSDDINDNSRRGELDLSRENKDREIVRRRSLVLKRLKNY